MAPLSSITMSRNQLFALGTAALLSAGILASCTTATQALDNSDQADGSTTTSEQVALVAGEVALFDSSVVHDIEFDFDQSAYEEMVEIYASTGDKDWIEATVTIDGKAFDNVGIRLKGNSSLRGLTVETSNNPEDLPWLVRLDKYVEGQAYQGYEDLVIRSNSTETALNEAVALELLEVAGLASEQAISTAFTVNGGETELRLAIEHPDDAWDDANFANDDAALYKADSEGDYSYRGDDPDAYEDVFNQKAGEDDLEPLTGFLDFINNAADETFNAELADRFDIEAFATYLAFQDLIGNGDDISGRGNNSYLHYDYETEQFTVVSWDLNVAFGTANGNGDGGPGARPDGTGRPTPPADGANAPRGQRGPGGPGGPGNQANVLADRFMADETFSDLYDEQASELMEALYGSGAADEIIADWVTVLSASASNLVSVDDIKSDAAAIVAFISRTNT